MDVMERIEVLEEAVMSVLSEDKSSWLKDIFPNLPPIPTEEELRAKEDSFHVGDRVKVSDHIRCRQKGKVGTISRIDPDDGHGWKLFVVKFDDEQYGSMGFQSGYIDKVDE